MKIDVDKMIAISKVNQNFSEASKLAEEYGVLTIMKNSKPKFVLMTFENFVKNFTNEDR